MSALIGDGSRVKGGAGCGDVWGCLGVFFVAHGLRRWCLGMVHILLAIFCWLEVLPRGSCMVLKAAWGTFLRRDWFFRLYILALIYEDLSI